MSRWTVAALPLLLLAACSKSGSPAERGDDRKPAAAPAPAPRADGKVLISVTEKGFEPTPIQVAKGVPVTLVVTRKTDQTCATEITIPEYEIDKKLPLDQPVEITFTPNKAGELVYGCAMDHMISGVLQVR